MDILFSEKVPTDEEKQGDGPYFAHALNTLYMSGHHLEKQWRDVFLQFDAEESKADPKLDLGTEELYQASQFEQVEGLISKAVATSIQGGDKGPSVATPRLRRESAEVMKVLANAEFPTLEDIDASTKNYDLQSFAQFGEDTANELKEHQKERNYMYSPYDIPRGYANYQKPAPGPVSVPKNKLNDLLYRVAVYHPLTGKKTHEYLVTGSQTLHEIKKAIYCVTDTLTNICEPHSGSFFFIEGCFYEDESEASVASELVTAQRVQLSTAKKSVWEEKKEFAISQSHRLKSFPYVRENYCGKPLDELRGAGARPFVVRSMLNTKWKDVILRLGVPYLFRHKSGCDHVVAVNDIRWADSSDPDTVGQYPLLVFQSKMKRFLCNVCSVRHAKYCHIK